MTEVEKLDAGLPYDFWDPEVNARKMNAIEGCKRLNACDPADDAAVFKVLKSFFGSVGEHASVLPGFICDNGKNIHVGQDFLANYNVIILDIAPVRIGEHVMIGPNTMISTVNHPMTPMGRRKHLGIAKPVTIGDDVWIGGSVTILPGVTIGNNVIVAAGAVVTKDVPDNTLVGGVPAKVIRTLENDIPEDVPEGRSEDNPQDSSENTSENMPEDEK
jgi:maltose O-acetyltransferase